MTGWLMLVIVLLSVLYLASGLFGAYLITKIWRTNKAEEFEELDYDMTDETKLHETSDPKLLVVCQCLCVLFGPVVPGVLLGFIFLAYIVLTLIGGIMWCVNKFKER